MSTQLTLDDVRRAADVLHGVVHRTPVLASRSLDARTGASILLKAENFQRTGAFKFRGAYNKVSSIPEHERARGVCTVSSGNHAQALACVARELGIPAAILMPADVPKAKHEATAAYGAEIVFYDRYSIPQVEAGRRFQLERGVPFVTSHDDPMISAGAGTAALELIEDAGPIDVLIAPISGGGGMAGYATVVRALCPGARVVGAEPAAGGATKRSLAAGERVHIEVPTTIADGLQLTVPGAFTFEVMRRLVDDVVLVTDGQIIEAMAWMFERMKIVTEPSGAIALAAVMAGAVDVAGARVGIIVTGGNIGAERFAALIAGARAQHVQS